MCGSYTDTGSIKIEESHTKVASGEYDYNLLK